MASRLHPLRLSSLARSAAPQLSKRTFHASNKMMAEAVVPPRKPVGAFKGTAFGFLSGAVLAGGSLYYYLVDEYKSSNQLLTEDIYALQSAVVRLESYVKKLEEQVPKK